MGKREEQNIWNSEKMREVRGQDDIINMQGRDDKIKRDRGAAG